MKWIVLLCPLCGCIPHYDIPDIGVPPKTEAIANIVPKVQVFTYVTAPTLHKEGKNVCMTGSEFLARDNALYGCTESLATSSSSLKAVALQRDYLIRRTSESTAYDANVSKQYEKLSEEYTRLEAATSRMEFMYNTTLGAVLGLVLLKALKP